MTPLPPARIAGYGRRSTCPTRMKLGLVIPLSFASAVEVVPKRAAIAPSVSPALTV